jgi:hypothetical protein
VAHKSFDEFLGLAYLVPLELKIPYNGANQVGIIVGIQENDEDNLNLTPNPNPYNSFSMDCTLLLCLCKIS